VGKNKNLGILEEDILYYLAIYLNFIRNWKSIMKLKPQKIVQIEKIN
jgi:hypothetical protein